MGTIRASLLASDLRGTAASQRSDEPWISPTGMVKTVVPAVRLSLRRGEQTISGRSAQAAPPRG